MASASQLRHKFKANLQTAQLELFAQLEPLAKRKICKAVAQWVTPCENRKNNFKAKNGRVKVEAELVGFSTLSERNIWYA